VGGERVAGELVAGALREFVGVCVDQQVEHGAGAGLVRGRHCSRSSAVLAVAASTDSAAARPASVNALLRAGDSLHLDHTSTAIMRR